MYSIKNTQDIKFNYNNTSIRKISEHLYQYHGKPNEPNLVLMNGIKHVSYIAETIEVKPGNPNELVIHHITTSNFPKKAIVKIPLVIKENSQSTVDRLLDMKINDTLDLDISKDITDYSMEINESNKDAYIIRLTNGIPIEKIASKKPGRKIIEGACGLTDIQKNELAKLSKDVEFLMTHAEDNSKHSNTLSEDITTAVNNWLNENHSDELLESSNDDREMECFPNEGKVFNKRFHIVYDDPGALLFINEAMRFIGSINTNKKEAEHYIRHKDAINDAVNELKTDIERMGGIYVKYATTAKDRIKADNDNVDSIFNSNTDIDILITYKIDGTNNKLRKLDENGKVEGAVTQVRQVKDAIFVAYKDGNGSIIPMNSVKFSRDYLNKDYSKYTHITINGYLTGTQNQLVYSTTMFIVTIIGLAFMYYAIPSVYKTVIRIITNDDKTCGSNSDNYNKVRGFNYCFILFFIIIPGLFLFTGLNLFTMGLPSIGFLVILILWARYKLDE